jgi:DNA-binding Lrp family transcriptional regulator
MELTQDDLKLVETLCGGLPLVADPYAQLGRRVGFSETEVLSGIQRLINGGIIKRFGVIVQHRQLGYTANGMSVWNIADDRVSDVGERMGRFPFVTLCYRRPRHLPDWPYNLFAMVHGSNRDTVLQQVADIAHTLKLEHVERDVLFSMRQFKQCGARYECKERAKNEPFNFD